MKERIYILTTGYHETGFEPQYGEERRAYREKSNALKAVSEHIRKALEADEEGSYILPLLEDDPETALREYNAYAYQLWADTDKDLEWVEFDEAELQDT